jgi:cell division septum initiation protein DivIVA
MVAAELARLQERERFLEAEMRAMQTRGMSSPGRLDEETVTTLLGEEAARVLSTARDASTQIRDRAEESATRLVKDAAEDAARIRESANLEAQRIRDDAAADAEAEIEMAKQQGRDMVNEAREYREKVLSELSRRRDAARAQIEQLLHGRDRLMSAFERARLASEDVISGLGAAHDEPEFIVNLAPVTGPIPVINPDHPSHGIFDREREDNTTQNVDVVSDVMHEENAVVVEDIAHKEIIDDDVVDELVHVDDAVDNDFIEVETGTVESVEVESVEDVAVEVESVEVVAAEVVAAEVVAVEDDSQVAEEIEPSTDDHDSMANVVSLFGRERHVPVLPEVHEVEEIHEVIDEVDEVAVVSDIAIADKASDEPKVDSGKVNDIFARLRADTVTAVVKAVKKQTVIADPKLFAERDEALAPLVVQFSRKLKRVLADEQNTVLEHLRKKRSLLEIEAMLGSIEEHALRYNSSVSEETMKAATEGAKTMKDAGGSSRRVTKKAVEAAVHRAITNSLVTKFREDTRIAIGEAEGDRDILAGLMRDVYRQWKMSSLDEHVDDIACAAFGCGAYLALEPGAKVAWMVNPERECCADCADNSLAESVTVGEEFPTGHQHPLAHSGCRCLVRPITH